MSNHADTWAEPKSPKPNQSINDDLVRAKASFYDLFVASKKIEAAMRQTLQQIEAAEQSQPARNGRLTSSARQESD